jgi:hypothetical protein
VKTYRILILIGVALYAVSFFLIGVSDASNGGKGGIPGYTCATTTLLSPWGGEGLKMVRESPIDFFSVLISGWINPVFLITVIVLLCRPKGRLGGILTIVLLLMFPACWIVFYRAHLQPRAGYFLWTAAMLLVLFAPRLARTSAASQKPVDIRTNIS